jgi:glycosyltransferase involved in cell wall biosynthesis
MNSNSVSVIIPTYNRAHLIRRAIDSVLKNLLPGDEIIVVDDGSTDNTTEILSAYGEQIRCIRGAHKGVGPARNLGIKAAKNPLVAFLDSDDEWFPDKLQLQRAVLDTRPELKFCCTNFAVRFHGGIESRFYLANWQEVPRPWSEIFGPSCRYSSIAPVPPGREDFPVYIGSSYVRDIEAPHICSITLLARKEVFEEADFPDDLPTMEEWECFSRMARLGQGAFLDCETAWNYSHPGPRITDADFLTNANTRLTILKRVWGSDPQFLAEHQQLFIQRVDDQHFRRARWFIVRGRTAEARVELHAASRTPLLDRLLVILPARPVQAMLRLTRPLRRHLVGKDRLADPVAT